MREGEIMDRDRPGRLARLDTLSDYKVADGAPDVRGWEVVGPDGETLGQVMHLIVEPEAMAVRYVEVELASGFHAGVHGTRRVLVPIGDASLDEERNQVVVQPTSAPDREAAVVDRSAGAEKEEGEREGDLEATLEMAARTGRKPNAGDDEIRVVLMREELVITKRLVAREEIVIRKHTVTEERIIEADLRRERLVVDDGRGSARP
jgi:hypothetical protein